MRETYELIVVNGVLTESANGNAHSAVNVTVKCRLRTVILFKIGDKLLGSMRKLHLLRLSAEGPPSLKDLLLGGLILKSYENSRSVSVGNGNTNALSCDNGSGRLNDLAVFNSTPNTKRLLLALLLLAANIGDNVIYHLRPLVEGLTCA